MSVEKQIAKMERLRRKATAGEWVGCGANDSRCQCRQVWSRSADVPIFYALREADENWTGGKGVSDDEAKNNAAHIVTMHNGQEALLRIARAAVKLTAETDARYEEMPEPIRNANFSLIAALASLPTEAKR